MAESTTKVRVDVNHQDLTKAGDAISSMAEDSRRYIDHLGEGKRDLEQVNQVLQRQLTSQRDIQAAIESQRRAYEAIRRIHDQFSTDREQVWGNIAAAKGAPPAASYDAFERKLEQREHEVERNLERLGKLSEHAGGLGGQRGIETLIHAAQIGAAWLGIRSAYGFGQETIAANRALFPSIHQAALMTGGHGGAGMDALYGTPTAPPGVAGTRLWNLVKRVVGPFFTGAPGAIPDTPEATEPINMTPAQEGKWRMTQLGMGPGEQGAAIAREARLLGHMPDTRQSARMAEFGAVTTGSTEGGIQLYERMYQRFFSSEAQANAIMLGMLRYSASGVPRSELVAQNQNMLDLVASRTASRAMTDEEATLATGLQGALAHVGKGYGRGIGGIQALQAMVAPTSGSAFAEFRSIEAYTQAYGKSPYASPEDYARYLELKSGEGLRDPKFARASMEAFQRDYKRYGAAWMKINEFAGDPTMTMEKIKQLGEAPLLEDFDRIMGSTRQKSPRRREQEEERTRRHLDRNLQRVVRATSKMRGARIAESEAVAALGKASSEAATALKQWTEQLQGSNPNMGYILPALISGITQALTVAIGLKVLGGGGGALTKFLGGSLVAKIFGAEAAAVLTGAAASGGAAAPTAVTAAEVVAGGGGGILAPGLLGTLGTLGGMYLGGQAGSWLGTQASRGVMGAWDFASETMQGWGPAANQRTYRSRTRGSSRLGRNALARRAKLLPLIDAAAKKYGLDPAVFEATIFQESGYDPDAESSAGARGAGQIMPATGLGYGVSPDMLWDPATNIDLSARIMAENMDIARRTLGPGASMDEVEMEARRGYFAGWDKSMWGRKTHQYGFDVEEKEQRIRRMRAGSPVSPAVPHVTRAQGQSGVSTADLIALARAMRDENAVEVPPPDQSASRMLLGLSPDAANMVELLPHPGYPWEHPYARSSRG